MIASTVSRSNYPGTGGIVPLVYPFLISKETDLKVTKRSALGVETALVWPIDFAVSGVGVTNGGTVTPTVAPAVGELISIRRVKPESQLTDLKNQSTFFADTYESALDNLTMMIQQIQDQADRSVRFSESYDPAGLNMAISPGTAGQVLSSTGVGVTWANISTAGIVLPGQGRTVPTLTAFLSNNAVFNVMDYGGVGDGIAVVDAAAALVAAAANAVASSGAGGAIIMYPPGTWKHTLAFPNITGSVTIAGHGIASSNLKFYGVPGITLSGDMGRIENLGLTSLSAGGAADPKLFDGVTVPGTSVLHINYIRMSNVYLRGWSRCVYYKYGWDGIFDRIFTTNCDKGFVMAGLAANNGISNSKFLADTHGISLILDAGFHGEGLDITNTKMLSCAIGVYAEQFISLNIAACTIDQTGIGLSLTNCTGSLIGSWVYAQAGHAVRFEDLGVITVGQFKVMGCPQIQSTVGASIYVGAFVRGLHIAGNTLNYFTAPVLVAANASQNIIGPNQTIDSTNKVSLLMPAVSQTDADADLTIGDGGFEQLTYYFNLNLTANRVCRLPTRASCWNGRGFWIRREAGAGTLSVQESVADGSGVLKVLPAATPSAVFVQFAGALGAPKWILTCYSIL